MRLGLLLGREELTGLGDMFLPASPAVSLAEPGDLVPGSAATRAACLSWPGLCSGTPRVVLLLSLRTTWEACLGSGRPLGSLGMWVCSSLWN